jgi:hypothetical protein
MIRDVRQAIGLCFALLALVAQLMLASAVPASTVSLADVTTFCQHDGDRGPPAAPDHRVPNCLLCSSCQTLANPGGLVAAPPWLPVPQTMRLARKAVPPPATPPPPRVNPAASPRGPPIPT